MLSLKSLIPPLFGRVGSNSTLSETYQFSLPYTGWFLLLWSCREEKAVQRLFKYKKHRIRHFFKVYHKEISNFFSASSLARFFTSVKGHCIKLFQYRSSFRDGFGGWQWSGRRRKCRRFWRTGEWNCSVRSQGVFLEGSVRPLPPCDRSSLLAEEVFCLIS